MREIEELLRKDRERAALEVPDVRYTAAGVRRRMVRAPVPEPAPSIDWAMILACGGIVGGGALTAIGLGLNPWWLALVPFSAIPFFPILIRKGAGS